MVLDRRSLNCLDPTIKPFVAELFNSDLFLQHAMEITSIDSGSLGASLHHTGGHCDRFKLILPFAGYSISWEVIFNGSSPNIPPDFIFDDESFLFDCNLEGVPSLINWPASKEKSLVCVISELLNLYTKFQWQTAEKNLSPIIGNWLDLENVMNNNWKVEILNGSYKPGQYSPSVRQRNPLQSGDTSVVVGLPIRHENENTNDMQFSIQYIFKSNTPIFDEKLHCSPQLKPWVYPYMDCNRRRRSRSSLDPNNTTLSATVHQYCEEFSQKYKKSRNDFEERERVQLKVLYTVKSNEDHTDISLLEFDNDNYKFSSCLYQGKIILTIDYNFGAARAQLVAIEDDGSYSKQTVPVGRLMDPSFNILELLKSAFSLASTGASLAAAASPASNSPSPASAAASSPISAPLSPTSTAAAAGSIPSSPASVPEIPNAASKFAQDPSPGSDQ